MKTGEFGRIAKKKKQQQYQPVPEAGNAVAPAGGMSAQHVDWRYAKYKTCKASGNSHAGIDGKRHACRSPYM